MTDLVCHEIYWGDVECGGRLLQERIGDFDVFTCEKCGIERAGHARTLDRKARGRSALEKSGIPESFRGRAFVQDDDNRDAVRVVKSWLSELELLPAPAFVGPAGTGKSHLMAATCARVINDLGQAALFTSVRSLLRGLQRFEDAETRERLWERVTSVDVLALDDLGAQRDTDWRSDELADLIDIRYERELPVLVATNFAPQSWERMLDSRTVSRLRGMTFAVELRGRDRRQERLGMAA